MDKAVESVLTEYDKRASEEWKMRRNMSEEQEERQRDDFLLSIGPQTGQLLNILIRGAKAQHILEIGTSYGHSTVWLAEAAHATGGRVVTIDCVPNKHEYARAMIAKAGLAQHVEFRLGDAREVIVSLPGPFDFVLLDLWKDLYIPCFDLFYSKLSRGAYVAADNMINPEWSRADATAYRKYVRAKPDIESVLLKVGSGIELSCYGESLPVATRGLTSGVFNP